MNINDNKDPNKEPEKKWSDKLDETKDSIQEKYEEVTDNLKESIDETKENINESVKTGVKATKNFFKKLIIGLFVLAILALGVFMLYSNWTFSEGTRAGNLMKISKKGYVFKTYEGQLGMEGMQPDENGGLSSVWNFSVKDDELYKRLESLQGKEVTIKYKEINRAMPWQGDTNYFVYDVDVRQ